MDRFSARAKRLIGLWALRRLGSRNRRSAADCSRQLSELRTALGPADRLKLLKVRLGPRRGAHFDHRFALYSDGVRVVGLKQQRLVRHANGLAEQMLLLGHAGDIDERAPVARVDGERGLEKILGLFELTGGDGLARLVLQLNRLGRDLVVGALTDGGRGERNTGSSNQQEVDKGLH